MRDCTNGEMKDLLPDLLHDRLAAAVRAEVHAHLATCDDCRAELELLVRVQNASVAPRIDVARIAAELPDYRPLPLWQRRVSSRVLQIAAAIVVVVGAATVFGISRSGSDDASRNHSVAVRPALQTATSVASSESA